MSLLSIFSRGIDCPFPLVPGWDAPAASADVRIAWGPAYRVDKKARQGCRFLEDGTLEYLWSGEARYRIGADQIRIDPIGEPELPAVRESLLGPMLAYCMHLRGDLVLHAAGLVTPRGEGLLLLGHSGMGKSTLSARALAMGARLVNEDIVILRQGEEGWWMEPGWPVMRLDAAVADPLGMVPIPEIAVSGSPKRAYLLREDQFQRTPVPLRGIVMLARGGNERRVLPVGEGLHSLLELTYTLGLLQPETLKHYFQHYLEIVGEKGITVLKSEIGEGGIQWSLEALLEGGDL